uniref:Uncharacterized protein n=1 Tax=Anopheles coluzzii TaxID=1518534 RepID=A0A8W7PUA4_ANOCL
MVKVPEGLRVSNAIFTSPFDAVRRHASVAWKAAERQGNWLQHSAHHRYVRRRRAGAPFGRAAGEQPPPIVEPGLVAQVPPVQLVPPRYRAVEVEAQPLPRVAHVLALQEEPAAGQQQTLGAGAGHDRALLVPLAQPKHGPAPQRPDVHKLMHDRCVLGRIGWIVAKRSGRWAGGRTRRKRFVQMAHRLELLVWCRRAHGGWRCGLVPVARRTGQTKRTAHQRQTLEHHALAAQHEVGERERQLERYRLLRCPQRVAVPDAGPVPRIARRRAVRGRPGHRLERVQELARLGTQRVQPGLAHLVHVAGRVRPVRWIVGPLQLGVGEQLAVRLQRQVEADVAPARQQEVAHRPCLRLGERLGAGVVVAALAGMHGLRPTDNDKRETRTRWRVGPAQRRPGCAWVWLERFFDHSRSYRWLYSYPSGLSTGRTYPIVRLDGARLAGRRPIVRLGLGQLQQTVQQPGRHRRADPFVAVRTRLHKHGRSLFGPLRTLRAAMERNARHRNRPSLVRATDVEELHLLRVAPLQVVQELDDVGVPMVPVPGQWMALVQLQLELFAPRHGRVFVRDRLPDVTDGRFVAQTLLVEIFAQRDTVREGRFEGAAASGRLVVADWATYCANTDSICSGLGSVVVEGGGVVVLAVPKNCDNQPEIGAEDKLQVNPTNPLDSSQVFGPPPQDSLERPRYCVWGADAPPAPASSGDPRAAPPNPSDLTNRPNVENIRLKKPSAPSGDSPDS